MKYRYRFRRLHNGIPLAMEFETVATSEAIARENVRVMAYREGSEIPTQNITLELITWAQIDDPEQCREVYDRLVYGGTPHEAQGGET